MNRLVPSNVTARMESAGRFPFAFGRRFFLFLLIGLAWIVPAWNEPRLLYAMLVWDLFVVGAWAVDLLRLPSPEEIEMQRKWQEPLGLAQKCNVTIAVQNNSGVPIWGQAQDE